jgi:hypothetical protein
MLGILRGVMGDVAIWSEAKLVSDAFRATGFGKSANLL